MSPLGNLGLMNRVLHEEHSLQCYLKLPLEINIILRNFLSRCYCKIDWSCTDGYHQFRNLELHMI